MTHMPAAGGPTEERIVVDEREPLAALYRDLRTTPTGITAREAARRLTVYGANELTRKSGRRWPPELLAQFTQPLAVLLMVADARTALAADGWAVDAQRLPDPARPDLLARLKLGAQVPPDPEAVMMAGAMKRRRSDRRAFADRVVPDAALTRFRRFVEYEGAYLHVVRPDQVPALAVYTEVAANAERNDPRYREELRAWTSRPAWSRDGVPPATGVQPSPRRVPVREFVPAGATGMPAGPDVDRGASYVIIFGRDDQPINLLRGGEALSALLLKATAEGLATDPLSDIVEVRWPRHLLRDLLAGIGEPYVVVRLGYRESGDPLPPVPRRDPAEVIEIVE